MSRRCFVAFSVALLVGTLSAQGHLDTRHLFTWRGDSLGELMGFEVKAAGDVNRDGYADVIVGSWGDNVNGPASGAARVYSGRDGSLLHAFRGRVGTFFGYSVGGNVDFDGDGHSDVIVGSVHDRNNNKNFGSARIFSGKTGKELAIWWGEGADDLFGHSVSAVGDIDKDGTIDWIVGAPHGRNLRATQAGYAKVFSGKTGKLLWRRYGEAHDELFGYRVVGLGDVNGDSVGDWAVGAPHDPKDAYEAGSVHVFSGKTRQGALPLRRR